MGPDKTGSTAIQIALRRNAAYFQRLGVLCSPDPRNNDRMLSVAFCKTEKRAKKLFNVDKKCWLASKEYLKVVKERFYGTAAGTLILSHEGLVHLNKAELMRLYSFLQSLAENVHVVFYARSPESYATSAMCQCVKTGRRIHLIYPPVQWHMNFSKRIISVFGREHLDVRLFDRKVFPSGDVVLDFLSIPLLKQLQSLDGQALVREFQGNPAFSQVGLRVGKRIIKILGDQAPRGRQFQVLFAEDLYLLKGQKIVLFPFQVELVKKASARHTKFLKREFDIDFSGSISNISSELPDNTTSWQIESIARDLIVRRLPGYRLSRFRQGWRRLLCWGADMWPEN